jgi:FkbM family methyltransferase
MNLYRQEPEAHLLAQFISRLEHRSVIDVGAERGAFAEELIRGGADEVHVIDPEPENAESLRERFREGGRVTVHECAISSSDGELKLRKSSDPTGAPVTFGHTVLERPDTDEIAWRETITVTCRSLASLVAAGDVPGRVGIVKVDTEGHDLAVVEGMGDLDCDVVMVEHWTDLPHSLGPCPWSTEEMVSALRPRGFSHFAFIAHREPFTILQWDDGRIPTGQMGNMVFLHDRVVGRLLPDVLECASTLAVSTAEVARTRAIAADERLAVIEELTRERELLIEAGEDDVATIEELTRERDAQTATAEERLAVIENLMRDRDGQAAAAADRLATIEELSRARMAEAAASAERSEVLVRDRDALASAAEERLAVIGELTRERDLQAAVAAERLATLEELTRERDLQAAVAAERLTMIEDLTTERNVQANAAEARLAVLEELERARELRLGVRE